MRPLLAGSNGPALHATAICKNAVGTRLGIRDSVIGALVTAVASTAGDYLWKNVLPHGQPVYWFAHAIVLFVTVGACLGWPTRKPLAGAVGAVIVGCAATLGFYLLQPLMGYPAMFPLFFG